MNPQEKLTIYRLLKTASDSICQYKNPAFPDKEPDFTAQKNISLQPQNTEAASVQRNPEASLQKNENPIPESQIKAPEASPAVVQIKPADLSAPSQKIASAVQTGNNSPALSALEQKINECKRCPLCQSRKNAVKGTGCTSPVVLVIGDAPDYEENAKGTPFTGPNGNLLDKMLAAIQLSRFSNTYLTNVVKCFPPQGRNPYPEEAEACASFLQAQIAVLKPKMILCTGSVAAKYLLNDARGIDRLRGSFYEYSGIPVGITYSPAALNKTPALKAPAWEDLQKFRQMLLEISPDYPSSFLQQAK